MHCPYRKSDSWTRFDLLWKPVYLKSLQVFSSCILQLFSSPAQATMSSRSDSGEKQSRPQLQTSGCTKNSPPRLESNTSPSCTLTVGFDTQLLVCRLTYLAGWHTNARRLRRICGQGAREGGNSPSRRPATRCDLFLRFCDTCRRERRAGYHEYVTHLSTQMAKISNGVIGIRATDVALGLRRVPAGFYTAVHHSGLEWKTENKPSSVNDDVVEWSGPIPM